MILYELSCKIASDKTFHSIHVQWEFKDQNLSGLTEKDQTRQIHLEGMEYHIYT